MVCNGFHISEVIRECVKELGPIEENSLVNAVDQSLDSMFRIPPSNQKNNMSRTAFIRQTIRQMCRANRGIKKEGQLYVIGHLKRSYLFCFSGKIRAFIKDKGKCTKADVQKAFGVKGADRLRFLVKTGHLCVDDGLYSLTPTGVAYTVDPVARTRRLCGFKPALV